MQKQFKYSCGCSFTLLEEEKNLINFDPISENINLDCQKTWALISCGNTKGCFQLESRLGRSMAKKLKPSNIEELSGLISILRPGCLEAYRDGKSVSNHYIDKKNGLESVDYYHPSLQPILNKTYGEMIYQEQAMEIAKIVAGFDLKEADNLRKAIGKKKPEEMAKLKLKFLEGAERKKIITKKEAEEIFGWIEKSQRYSFNKSHAISYAYNAYLSAYAKAHFPKIFFASYLRYAKDKIDPKSEIKELVQNASEMDININIPDLRIKNKLFVLKNNKIYFGLTDIKGFGESVFNKLLKIIDEKQLDIDNMLWPEILTKILLDINSTAGKSLIKSGALDFCQKSRCSMLFEYAGLSELTKKEINNINEYPEKFKKVNDCLKYILDYSKLTQKRKITIENILKSIINPPYSMEDTAEWISDAEDEVLGCSITCSKVDMYDISMTNCNCKDIKTTLSKDNLILCAEIDNINIVKTKNGKNPGSEMAFVTLCDSFGLVDNIVFFPDSYKQYRNILFLNNVIVIQGKKNKTMDSIIVEKAYLPKS
jgi:DNA polymerase-3 subunit alpha